MYSVCKFQEKSKLVCYHSIYEIKMSRIRDFTNMVMCSQAGLSACRTLLQLP